MKSQRPSRFQISLNVILTLLFAGLLVAVVNYLSFRHYRSFDFSTSKTFTLSDKTLHYLKSLKHTVSLYFFFNPDSNPKLFSLLDGLLRQYQEHGNDKIKLEIIDPNQNRLRTEQLAKEYHFEDAVNTIIVAYEGKTKMVYENAMVEMDFGSMFGGEGGSRIKKFKAEEQITSAIASLVEGKASKVYFLTGHGERDITASDSSESFSEAANRLRNDNIEVLQFNPVQKGMIPDDAAAVVIAGPIRPYQPSTIEILHQYLTNKNGRVFLMLDPQTQHGLDGLLARYGIHADNNYVIGAAAALIGGQMVFKLTSRAAAAEYGKHPIVNRMNRIATEFLNVQSLQLLPTNQPPGITELVKSSPDFWGETDFDASGNAKFNEGKDLRGPLTLAVAVDLGKAGGENVNLKGPRVVVTGSSSMFANGALTTLSGTLDFFLNSINWLVERENLIGISPKEPREFSLMISDGQLITLAFLIGLVLPGFILFIGISVWLKRRR